MTYDSDSSLKVYLREISKTPLLTPEEEVKLARKLSDRQAAWESRSVTARSITPPVKAKTSASSS